MTPDQYLDSTLKLIERTRADARRKLITDLLMHGYTDDEIETALEVGDELFAEDWPQIERNIVEGVREMARDLLGVEWSPKASD